MGKKVEVVEDAESKLELKEDLLEKLSAGEAVQKREISVMTRLTTDLVDVLDMFIKLGVYSSRSEAVSAILEKTLLSQPDTLKELQSQIKQLEEIQGKAKGIAHRVISGDE